MLLLAWGLESVSRAGEWRVGEKTECSDRWESEGRLGCKIKSPLQQWSDVKCHEFFIQNNYKILHNRESLGYLDTAIQFTRMKKSDSTHSKSKTTETRLFWRASKLLQLLWQTVWL